MNNGPKPPKLTFIGAAGTVTGSKTLLTYLGKNILIDCGLFQGPKAIRLKNWQEFEIAKEIDAVVLTHAHIDHTGYLPKLAKEGYEGPIYCTQGTFDICQVLLPDSAYLQEEDAKYANRSKHSRHHPALPLYDHQDAQAALNLFQAIGEDEWVELFPGISTRLLRSGHILGSSFVQFNLMNSHSSKLLTFSGDIGNGRQNVIKGPVNIRETDYLVMEGTYGDRKQSREDPSIEIAKCINKAHNQGGIVVIPSFAVGRTQEILYILKKLEEENKIPKIPVYLDSPMANRATEVYLKHRKELKLSTNGSELSEPIHSAGYEAVVSPDDSMLLCMRDGPFVVISAAGMLTGGRVLHHLKHRLPDPKNIVIFVGWQAEETKGRLLQGGLPKIRIHHKEVDVEAEIVSINSLSAHGDTEDIVNWIKEIEHPPKKVFLNHGETQALNALKYRLTNELNLDVEIPTEGQEVELN